MMNSRELESWAWDQGGPSIRLRIYSLRKEKARMNVESICSELLRLEEVKAAPNCLNAFQTQARDKKTIEHLVHYYKAPCIDRCFSKLTTLGLYAGMPVFDVQFQPMARLFSDLQSEKEDYGYYYSLMLHRFFFMSGYEDSAVIASMVRRIDALYRAAKEHIFDIYRSGAGLPKVPAQWAEWGILREEMSPFSRAAECPLPTIYDLSAMAYFPEKHKDADIQKKIDEIAAYVLDPEFQKIPEYYGLLWDQQKRRFYACGWAPVLPLYENRDGHGMGDVRTLFSRLHIMSHFDSARRSKWYSDCLDYLAQFRTERETYIFPKKYLDEKSSSPGSISRMLSMPSKPAEAFLNSENQKRSHGERELLLRELLGTINMLEICE